MAESGDLSTPPVQDRGPVSPRRAGAGPRAEAACRVQAGRERWRSRVLSTEPQAREAGPTAYGRVLRAAEQLSREPLFSTVRRCLFPALHPALHVHPTTVTVTVIEATMIKTVTYSIV